MGNTGYPLTHLLKKIAFYELRVHDLDPPHYELKLGKPGMSLIKQGSFPLRHLIRCFSSNSSGFLKSVNLECREGGSKDVDFSKPTVLYFSAGWCRSCRLFTPKLKRFYDNVDGDMNVVWVSRDKSAEDQLEYYEKSLGPWPYIPFGNELIKEYLQNYEVKTIPAILLVGENGKVVDDAIRGKIENCCSPEDAKKIISEWKGQ
ncbi:hypothetical protein QR680_002272 [Steinernema hermaphroditum]|uniref:protein-disulfide reductase n=1 Tax=Steinernema hermaphroditum TaxID=289476 RepID=A0AA39LHX7_9BILA|nr:hypothetical protein QR680_002272 [Steinernema hermaphroditum]